MSRQLDKAEHSARPRSMTWTVAAYEDGGSWDGACCGDGSWWSSPGKWKMRGRWLMPEVKTPQTPESVASRKTRLRYRWFWPEQLAVVSSALLPLHFFLVYMVDTFTKVSTSTANLLLASGNTLKYFHKTNKKVFRQYLGSIF